MQLRLEPSEPVIAEIAPISVDSALTETAPPSIQLEKPGFSEQRRVTAIASLTVSAGTSAA